MKARLSEAHLLFLFVALLMSDMWASLHSLGLGVELALLVLVCWSSSTGAFNPLTAVPWGFPTMEKRGEALGVACLLFLPGFLYLLLTFGQEFPFMGDTDWHLLNAMDGLRVWRYQVVAVPFLVAGYLHFRKRYSQVIVAGAFTLLVIALNHGVDLARAARYPGGFYFLSFPMMALWKMAGWNAPLSAVRLTNIAAIPVWLFVLRPWLIRRWPDWRIVPFGCLIFLLKEVFFYLTSAYLEPWAMILLALAAEMILFRAPGHEWIPTLLCGLAGIIKEQAIFALPFVWIVGHWEELRRRDWVAPVLNGIIAAFPFVLYFMHRRLLKVFRSVVFMSPAEIFDPDHLQTFLKYNEIYWGEPGVVAAAILLLSLLTAIVIAKKHRGALLACAGAALAQFLLFYGDKESVGYIGYFRFLLLLLILAGAGLLVLADSWGKKPITFVVCAVLVVVNGIPLGKRYQAAFQADSVRNYMEHDNCPLFFPIGAVLSKWGETMGSIRRIRLVPLNGPAGPYFTWNLGRGVPLGYSDLAKQFTFVVPENLLDPRNCFCESAEAAVLVLPLYDIGVKRLLSVEEDSGRVQREACLIELEASCGVLREEKLPNGRVTAALGLPKSR